MSTTIGLSIMPVRDETVSGAGEDESNGNGEGIWLPNYKGSQNSKVPLRAVLEFQQISLHILVAGI